jgi:hypothetical protein
VNAYDAKASAPRYRTILGQRCSFGLVTAVCSCLRPGRDLVVWWSIRVLLTMLLEILVVVVIAVWVIVSLRSEMMHLLRACSKLILSVISSHRHCTSLVKTDGYGNDATYFVQEPAVRTWESHFHIGGQDSYQVY